MTDGRNFKILVLFFKKWNKQNKKKADYYGNNMAKKL